MLNTGLPRIKTLSKSQNLTDSSSNISYEQYAQKWEAIQCHDRVIKYRHWQLRLLATLKSISVAVRSRLRRVHCACVTRNGMVTCFCFWPFNSNLILKHCFFAVACNIKRYRYFSCSKSAISASPLRLRHKGKCKST